MKDTGIYKITILFLLFIIFLQWMFMATKPKVAPKVAPSRPAPVSFKGNIAIVIDDWAYNMNNLKILDRIAFPITCSVLPNLSYTREIAEELHARGFEVILHLPMEPHEKFRLEKNTILVSMNESAIQDILAADLGDLAYVRGVSNHMGSMATEDARVMETVFRELKKRNLYFLDSVVTAKSVGAAVAKKTGLRFARRDIFLDNVEDPAYIKKQIQKLKSKARSSGQAVGIGHDRRITLEVLAEVLPELKREGYRLVFVSELAK